MKALYQSRARLSETALDEMVLSLVLFSDSVLVNAAYAPVDEEIGRRTEDLVEAGLITPWQLPRIADAELAPWAKQRDRLEVDEGAYEDYAGMIQDVLSEYRGRSGDISYRAADLVDMATELWSESLAAYFKVGSVLGERGRSRAVIRKSESGSQDVSIARQFLSAQGLTTGLSRLSIGDIADLRTQFRRPVAQCIEQSMAALPGSSLATAASTDVALRKLILAYDAQVGEILSRSKPSPIGTAAGVAVDVAALKVTPLGVLSIFNRLKAHRKTVQRAPLVWFVAETKRRIVRDTGQV